MKLIVAVAACCVTACAQSTAIQSLPTLPIYVQVLQVPASTPATYLNLTVDASANGGDFIDVLSPNTQVLISLILPSGAVVTPSNANSLGFSVLQQVNSPGTAVTSGVFTPFDALGAHTTFVLPPASPGGVYQVQADSTNVASATTISVTYFSTSGVAAGMAKDKVIYNPGDNVSLTAFVFSEGTQLTGATASATVVPPISLNAQASIGNFQVVNQTANGAFTQYTYQASLTNNGSSSLATAIAKLINVPSSVALIDAGTLGFANVPPAGSVGSVNTFGVQVPSGQTFAPTTLSWDINTTGTPITVPLPDSGGGNYTGVYAPSVPGTYQVSANLTGTSSGAAFARTIYTTFQVVNPVATLSGITDAAEDDNGNGLFDRVVLSAQLNVETAGVYTFTVTLLASNGNTTTASGTATLSTGLSQISASVPVTKIMKLGVNGPFEKVRAAVSQIPASGSPVSVGFIADAGPTAPYTLASFDPGPIYFTGQNSATGLDTGGYGSFDVLQVQIGFFAPADTCNWAASLMSPTGAVIDTQGGSGATTAGNNAFTLNFNGNRIAQSGVNGPYTVGNAGVTCTSGSAYQSTLFQTSAFTASQFYSVAQGVALSLAPAAESILAGTSAATQLTLTTSGSFYGLVNLSVSGLPSGVTAAFATPGPPSLIAPGSTFLTLGVASSVAPGVYPLTVSGSSGTLNASAPLALTVVVPDFSLAVTPTTISVAPSSQVNSTVTVTPANTFTGTVVFSVSGLPTGSVASFLPASVSGGSPSTITLNIATNSATPGSYPFTITGTSGTLTHSASATLIVNPTALPYPWVTQGIGAGAAGGSATNNNGTFSVVGPGNSLNSTADSYQFTYQPWTGDGTLIGRVSQLQNATGIAMAGIMIRETLDPAAQNVFLGLNAGSAVTLQSRVGAGNSYTQTTGPTEAAPYWFELVRSSNTFTAYISPDGLHWTQVGSPLTVSMATSVYAGLALSSDANSTIATANFDQALITDTQDFYLSDTQPLSRTIAPDSPTGTYGITVVALNGFSSSVSLSAIGLPAGASATFSAPTIAGSGGTLMTVSAPSVAAGPYSIWVAATSGAVTRYTPATLIVSTTPLGGAADPWGGQDIGTAAAGTGTAFSNGSYTISGSGQSLTGTSDGFHFEYQTLVGDGAIIARVASVQSEQPASIFGVMMRDGLDPGALYAAMLIANNSGDQLDLLARTTAATAPVSSTGASITEPYWVELVRAGDTFTGYASPDGINWTQVGSTQTISMNAIVLVGLAVSSGDPTQITTVNFDNITISSGADFYLVSTAASISAPPGAGVYYSTIKMLATNGSFGTANFSVSGAPAGVTATLSASSLSPGQFTNLQLNVSAAVAPGTYPITVTGTASSLSHSAIVNLNVGSTGTPLPQPWAANDIGPVAPGTSTFNPGGTITVQGSGSPLTGTPDAFRYTYQSLTGDGTMFIHVDYLNNIWDVGSAGVMIRESLLPDAAYAYARIRVDVLVGTFLNWYGGLQYRPAEGGTITQTETAIGINPYWVEIVRSGNVFSGFISPDGLTWTQIGASVTINMPPTVFIGLALTSGNSSGLTVAGFDSLVSVAGQDFSILATPASQTVPSGRGTAYYTATVAAFDNFSAPVTLSANGLPNGVTAIFNPATINGAGSTTVEIITSPVVAPGTYTIQMTGTSGSLVHSWPVTLVVNGAQTSVSAPLQLDFIGTGAPTSSFGATESSGVFTMTGEDCCIGGTSDTTFFVHQTLSPAGGSNGNVRAFRPDDSGTTGDGAIIVRVVSNTENVAAVTGVMIRDTLDPSSTSVSTTLTVAGDVINYSVDTRVSAGMTTTNLRQGQLFTTGNTNTPYWLKLIRSGAQVSIFASLDGAQWIRLVLPFTTNLAATTEIGFFASHGAIIDNVTVDTNPEFLLSAFPTTLYSMNGTAGNIYLTAYPSVGTATSAPSYSVTGLPAGVTAQFSNDPTITAYAPSNAGVTNQILTLTAAAGVTQGAYPITITATSGAVVGSTTVNFNVNPGVNIDKAIAAYGGISPVPAGSYGAPNPAVGLNNSYAFSFDAIYVGGISGTTGFYYHDDLSSPDTFGQSGVYPSSVTSSTTGMDIATDADPTLNTLGIHNIVVDSWTPNGHIYQFVPLELDPDYALCDLQGFYPVQCIAPAVIEAGSSGSNAMGFWQLSGFADAVSLSTSGFPSGISGSFSPSSLTATANPATTLTISVSPSVPAGTYSGSLVQTSSSVDHTQPYSFSVISFGYSTTQPSGSVKAGSNTTITGTLTYGVGGYPYTVTFGNGTLPTGVTVSYSPSSRTSAGSTTITIRTSASTPPGTYTLNFIATGNVLLQNAAPVTLVVTQGADFTISASTMAAVNAASNATSSITVAPVNGFTSSVALTVSGLPSGANGTFSPTSISGGSGTSTLTVTTTASIPGGTYPLTIIGTSGSTVHTTSATLSIKNFTLGVSPTSQSAGPGSTTAPYVVTMSVVSGFSSTVTFSTTGLPTGATGTFSPTTLAANGSTNLTIATTTSVAVGSYPFTIKGTSGSLTQSISATLVVSPDFSISTSSSAVTLIAAGSSSPDTVTIAPLAGFTGSVSLGVTGLPSGASGTFGTNPVTGGSGSSVLTLSAGASSAGGTYTLTVTGTSGSLVHSKTITLTIENFALSASPTTISESAGSNATSTVTLTMTGGFASTVTFGTSGLPTGASAVFSPASSSASGNTTLTVSTTAAVTAGNYSFNITGTSGSLVQSIPATLTVTAGFSLSNSGNVTVTAGGSNGTSTITLTASSGLTGATSLSASGLPTNATATFNPTSITGSGTSTLTFVAPATVAGGTYTITVTGTNGSLTRTTTLTLTVENFSLSISPTSLTVTHGGSNKTATVTLTVAGGFSSTVSFTATGQQSGVTITFNPTSRSSNGTTTMTVSASSSATRNTSTVTVRGTSGSLVQSVPLALTVN